MKVRRFFLHSVALGMAVTFILPGASVALAEGTLPLEVTAAGKSFSVADAATLDAAGIEAFVNGTVAPLVDVDPIDATRKVNASRRRIEFTAPVNGWELDRTASITAIAEELARRDSQTEKTAQTVSLPGGAHAPSVTGFDKSLLVVLKERRIYLYDNAAVVKKYSCAIGMTRYPTPTGTFTIKRKVKNPSWNNPGGAWGKGLPKYIKPGPSNPLGTRALYLYRNGGDSGVRFHGTSNTGSIGHAASHGCLRMRRADVEKFYSLVPVGTTVYIIK